MARSLSMLLACVAVSACAHVDPRRFPLAAPVLRDQDLESVSLPCDGAPNCAPSTRVSYLLWDAVDSSAFRPVANRLRVRRAGAAADVNALDEVPDSSFFTNRITTLSPEQVYLGLCADGNIPDTHAADGAWVIDHGKDNGQSPGFRIETGATRFMLKFDESQGEQSTAAAAIAARFYYAAGFWAPCDSVVYFRRSLLRITPGLSVQFNTGSRRPLDAALVDEELSSAPRRGELFRAIASRWLPGQALGPFAYSGTKADDPNDVIAHERRRPLRGSRLLAAWLAHFDAREQNTMATWLADDPARSGRGHVRHWILDLGDSFGLRWTNDAFSRRLNHAYFFDVGYMGEDFLTLGIPQRAWDKVRIRPGVEDFGYFDADNFDPEMWRPEYPMLPFTSMSEADGAWMARIIARFTPAHIEAAVRAGDLSKPEHAQFLLRTLLARQRLLLRRYFRKLSPMTDVSLEGEWLCAIDLAQRNATYAPSELRYSASVRRGTGAREPAVLRALPDAKLCVQVPSRVRSADLAANAEERYVVVRMHNGASAGPLELHLYDLGPDAGLRLVGIDRP